MRIEEGHGCALLEYAQYYLQLSLHSNEAYFGVSPYLLVLSVVARLPACKFPALAAMNKLQVSTGGYRDARVLPF